MRRWCFDEPVFPRRIHFKCTKKEKRRKLTEIGLEQSIMKMWTLKVLIKQLIINTLKIIFAFSVTFLRAVGHTFKQAIKLKKIKS